MALEEHDREDLLRDGRTMPVRGECRCAGETVLIGFRSAGQASLYWGSERVFQFDAAGRLRRVYLAGEKFAAQSAGLVQLHRQRRGGRVELVRERASEDKQSNVLAAADGCLQRIAKVTKDDAIQWRVEGSDVEGFRTRVCDWLNTVASPPQISTSASA